MKMRRLAALLLVMSLLFTCLAGCQNTDMGNYADSANGGAASGNGGGNGSDGNRAMGRYVEEVIDLAGRIDWYGSRLYKLSDGRIVISDLNRPFLISDDNGATWKEDDREWHSRMLREGIFASDITVGAENTVAVIYNDGSYDKEQRKYTGDQRLLVIRPDGTENLVDFPKGGGDKAPHRAGITEDGRIFVSMSGSSEIYEVYEDGRSEYFMTVQGYGPELMQFQGNLMFLDGVDYPYPLIYDLEKKEYVEDEVLFHFIKENYPEGNSYNGDSTYQMYFFTGEEGVLYVAGKKGLHRHVIGGSVMEQIIDGSLCTLNNPSYGIEGMVMLADNSFLTLFGDDSGVRLVRYAYDADVETVSADKLKVYSLRENDTIRQAVALFLTAYPDIAVEYEIGMAEGSSVTREDALKKLNTKIMAGEGPDVLILDDMPLDSYMEKGVLMDLSTILGSMSGEAEVFDSIVQAMKKEDKVYAMPCEIQIPVLMGPEKYIAQLQDLESTADMMEELRRDYPGKDLLYLCTEKGIMRYFAMSCVPAWKTGSGELDTGAIAEFLRQMKRIYDAQMDGLPEEIIAQYQKTNEAWLQNEGEYKDDSAVLRTGDNVINYVGGLIQMSYTALSDTSVYDAMVSVNKAEGFEGSRWTVMNGQCVNVFCAKTLLGISAASQNTNAAEQFIRLCLGRESQSNLFYGLAVNRAAFDENFHIDGYVERFLWLKSNAEGLETRMNVYPSTGEQIADLRSCIEAADTPYIEDTVLENAVYEGGIQYIQGAQSLEEAVSAIEQKVWIYMAE